ncbi:amino acid permease [Metschnikowia bicuspidata var. bicuspidata NRRL YB-4993]|uniref:Amino acid permease n=1 Tax=Metschnikowia bicuspidata var. bicuspidata NRRL YB-4993 TaxID=869754 RepID=A0A1A0HFF7_9ASCO|nr:amino acid permease [Metschnikowia bicuspidata var. bicuspidata NRRL YB-4993]OBA22632.1 amino acid permease [Metschnikowia bicuspidata var. bicuspidata NRRL YB-4993]
MMSAEKQEDQSPEYTKGVSGEHLSVFSNDPSDTYSAKSVDERPFFNRFIDSFKPMNLEDDGVDTSQMTEMEKSIYATSRHPLARSLKGRHLQMIAIGGSIGTGLFVGSGYALWQGGPAGQLISYILVGYSLFCVVNALGEMSVQFPVSGSFNAFFSRFVDPAWGFTVGLLYALSWLISFPSELVACSITILYWNSSINPAVWITVFYILICSINMFGVKGYGEVEFGLSIIKVLAVVGFIILGVCLILGVGDQGYIGAQYWHDPGAFNNGFKGVCSCFISAAFSFGGVELVALAASETANPRKSLPRATKQVFWRITIFYILTAVIIGCLVPYTDERLLSGTSYEDVTASPFVIAINNGGIKVLPDIMNAVILIAVVSVGNSSVYGCSRSLASLAVQGLLPKSIAYVDRAGRPLVAIMITNMFGLLGYLAADAENQDVVFTWFFSVCSLAAFFTWIAICFTHLRFRWALAKQGRSTDEVLFVAPTGVWGSLSGMVILSLIVVGLIWTAIWPIGNDGASNIGFWQACLSLPLMIVLWAGYKTYAGSWNMLMVRLEDIDLDTGRREIDIEVIKQEIAEEKAYIRSRPFWYRIYRMWC